MEEYSQMIDDASVLSSTKMKAAYGLVRSRLRLEEKSLQNINTFSGYLNEWDFGAQTIIQLVVAQVYNWLRILHVQSHQETHKKAQKGVYQYLNHYSVS